jgi:hypothetical protein
MSQSKDAHLNVLRIATYGRNGQGSKKIKSIGVQSIVAVLLPRRVVLQLPQDDL